MVSSDLTTDIDSRLGEIFMMIPEKAFASFSASTTSSQKKIYIFSILG